MQLTKLPNVSKIHVQKLLQAEIIWPMHSPDLNLLDYSLWGQSLKIVWEVKPKTIQELKAMIEEVFASLGPDLVKKSELNIKKLSKLCIKANGSHFDHLMQSD